MISDIRQIRKAASGKELPSPRTIGNLLAESSFDDKYENEKNNFKNNIMGLMFGQFLTHDTSNKLPYVVNGDLVDGKIPLTRCCTQSNSGPLQPEQINPSCIPVAIPANDTFYSKVDVRCQNYIRLARTFDNECKISYAPVILNNMDFYLSFVTR